MSNSESQRETASRDQALMALAQARDLIGTSTKPSTSEISIDLSRTPETADQDPQPPEPPRRGSIFGRGLIGLIAALCLGSAAFAWQTFHNHEEGPAKTDASHQQAVSQGQTAGQRATATVPGTTSTDPNSAQSIEAIVRELAVLERGIDQLRSGQTQLVQDKAELAEGLKSTQEANRRILEMVETLRATQAQLSRDNARLVELLKAGQEQTNGVAAQLKSNQDLTTSVAAQLKSIQEQIAHLSEQRPRSKPATTAAGPATAIAPRKPASSPASQPAKLQTLAPR